MAPTAPKKRPSIRARTSSTTTPKTIHTPLHRPNAVISSSFINSKKDKRTIKSNSFVTRIEKNKRSTPLRRRRPSKKLVAGLEGLGDALPDLDDDDAVGTVGGIGEGKVKMTSLTSGKGLMKRRSKLEKGERERFGKNMAELMGAARVVPTKGMEVNAESKPTSSTASRFAALRNWIGQTMEKEGAFE